MQHVYCRKEEATWEPALEEVSLISHIGRLGSRSHAHFASHRGSHPRVARAVLHLVRNSRLGAGLGSALSDVIAARRRRLRFCYFAGEVVGANGF